MAHFSLPIAAFSAVYNGSKSIRAGMIWLDFAIFGAPGTEPARVLLGKIGVVRPTAGRLKAAGSMSGILIGVESATTSRAAD